MRHFTAQKGWINDTNGLILYEGWYHLFYQHNPDDNRWGNMHWGHARSRDLVHWEHLPIALYPEPGYTMYSGSAIEDVRNLTGLKKGFVLCEDKNNQEFKLEVYDYDPDAVAPFIDRAEEVIYRYNRVVNDHKMVGRPTDATSPSCKRCSDCAMKDACWNIGIGRVKISG